MKPSPVSILVCTYGRTALLAEAVESFRRQVYDAPVELVIVNDCPAQSLVCNVPGVKVVNLTKPFEQYADKRNYALDSASHDLVCLWDDDDIYLPTFVASVVSKMHDDDKAMRLSSLMRWDGRFAKVISGSQHHTMVVRKLDLQKIGGWQRVPETDADLSRRLAMYRFFHGAHHHIKDDFGPLMVYRADADRIHMEGGGLPRLTSAEFQHQMDERIRGKKEPRGVVTIVPAWSQDWVKFVTDHLADVPS